MTAPGETRPDARGVVRVLFVLFLTYHAAGVLSTLIPSPSALADRTRPLFASYLRLTGTEQDWSMFTSVPNRQSSQVTVSSFDAAGLRREHGAIIPGLRDYDTDETFRYHSIFDRYSTPGFANYLPGYECKVADLVEAETGERPSRIQVVMTSNRIRYLRDIREGGGSTFKQVWKSASFEVEACND